MLFSDKLGDLDKLSSSKRVYFSALDNGNVYKAAIQVEGGQCAGFSPDSLSQISKITIGNAGPKDYETSASLDSVLVLMKEYSRENTVKPGHSDFMRILEFIIEKN